MLERVWRDGAGRHVPVLWCRRWCHTTGGTAELESLCYYICVCNIALPICLESLQTNREYREQLKINNKQGELYAEYFQIQYWVSSDGNPGLKDSPESRDEENTVYVFAETKHFITTTSACSPKLNRWQGLAELCFCPSTDTLVLQRQFLPLQCPWGPCPDIGYLFVPCLSFTKLLQVTAKGGLKVQ